MESAGFDGGRPERITEHPMEPDRRPGQIAGCPHPVDRTYADAAPRESDVSLEGLARRLGRLPLKFHPGTRWHYSFATDVCARLVEVIADRPFGDYLRETIFEPLGMADTGFTVPERARDRFATSYRRDEDGTLQVVP